jgi:hypothetical protein
MEKGRCNCFILFLLTGLFFIIGGTAMLVGALYLDGQMEAIILGVINIIVGAAAVLLSILMAYIDIGGSKETYYP